MADRVRMLDQARELAVLLMVHRGSDQARRNGLAGDVEVVDSC